jgi:MFS transporter, SP family, arabinose:H+ symporter
MFQFNIVFGILVAFLSNYLLANLGEHAWRWMLGVMAAPSLVYTFACFAIPESPRWLLGRGHIAEGRRVLKLIDPQSTEAEIEVKAAEITAAAHDTESGGRFWSRRLRTPILLAFLIAVFNQLSGINAVLYFAPRIFESAGLGPQAALLQSVGIGVTNLVFTFVGLWLIDRVGRRTLLVVGSLGYIGSLGLCSWAFSTGNFGIVPACLFAFIASHAVGQGAVIWVFISEIFPNRFRAKGQSLGCGTHWVFAALVTTLFPVMAARFDPGTIFGMFCAAMVLQLVWVKAMVPETKGRTLEEIERSMA